MSDWRPKQYLRFKEDRLRPAIDLLQRVNLRSENRIVDLGCGPGNSTGLLANKYPSADLIGIDNSIAMIETARASEIKACFKEADIQDWRCDAPVDLIFSNAVFHWLVDHKRLLTRLAKSLNSAGVLAFQMPDNLGEPSHIAIDYLLAQSNWISHFQMVKTVRETLASTDQYYDWLARDFCEIEIWRTTYSHVLSGPEQIVEWMKGAALVPCLDVLTRELRKQFLQCYLQEIVERYPERQDGATLFHFPRMFVVARKR